MKYRIKNKLVTIPDKEIKQFMTNYQITEQDAIKLWLEDNDYCTNDEIEKLTKQAKINKVSRQAYTIKEKSTEKKPRTVKTSDEKQMIFEALKNYLKENGFKFEVINENKLIEIELNNKKFKLDLIEKRPPKTK